MINYYGSSGRRPVSVIKTQILFAAYLINVCSDCIYTYPLVIIYLQLNGISSLNQAYLDMLAIIF